MERGLNKYLYYPLRAVTMALFILLIRQMTNGRFTAMMNDPSMNSSIPRPVFALFAILCTALITSSVVNLFSVYDKGVMFDYLDKKRQEVSFPRETREILTDKLFYLETIPHIAITVLFVFLDLYGEFTYILSFAGIIKKGFIGYTVVALICAIIVFSAELFTRYEARRYWHHLKNNKSIDKLSKKTTMVFKAALVIAVYPIAAPYLPYLVFMLFTLVGLVVTIANILTTFGLILTIILMIAAIKIYSAIRYRSKKARIIHDVTVLAKKEGYEYLLFEGERRDVEGCDILLTKGEDRYSIRIARTRGHRTPMYFTERDAYFLYKIGTKNHFRSIESHFDYTFDAEGERIILLPDVPRYLFVKEREMQKKLFPGDRIWGYIIYEPKSLLGNLDRDCLGRANNDRR